MGRQNEVDRLVVRVQQQEKGVGDDRRARVVELLDRIPRQAQPEAAREAVLPLLLRHLLAVGAEPREILDLRALDPAALEEPAAMEHRLLGAQADQLADEVDLAQPRARDRPRVPGDLVVLAIGVVVAALRAADLVAAAQHRNALREQEGGEDVSHLPLAEREDFGVLRRALLAAVPRGIVVGAVAVVLAVGLVVLFVVAHEVVEREAVVGNDEVDARRGPAAALLVEVARSREPIAQLGHLTLVALPVAADGVAILPVPLGPPAGEVADLIAALAQVPRFSDELHLRDDGVLLDDVEERGEPVDVVELPRERRRQVEAEPVHVHVQDPVAQAVHDELERAGMGHVERVPAARVVHVVAAVVLHEAVVGGVVDAAERQRRAQVIALGGVVVDHVEDDLDAGPVQRLHHGLELRAPARRGCPRRRSAHRARDSRSSRSPSSS